MSTDIEVSAFAQNVARGIVVLAGVYLMVLAAVAFARPMVARRFLLGFAQTAAAHYTEMAARILVGIALVMASPRMQFSQFFFWFGVVLLASSFMLLCLPWVWHRSLGQRVLPQFVRHLGSVAPISFLLGGVLVAASIAGSA